ncbi:MAG TPA: SPOR domain-containing protein [Gemmatimonadales bacterium]|nr:SPOR domain-containing protein [Gemmatimonadales bacterium]
MIIRLAAKGGAPRLYRLPALTELTGALRGRLPAIDRIIGADDAEGLLFVRTAKGEVLAYDLQSGRSDTVATGVTLATLGPDGTLFTVDAKRHVVSYSRRSRSVWPQTLAAVPQAMFGGADQRLIAVTAQASPKLVSEAADQPAVIRAFPGTGVVDVARWGDEVASATDSGVLLIEPLGRRAPGFVPLTDHPTGVTFSPAGHRLYVTRKTGLGLAVVDRFAREEMDGIALPGTARAIRLDPLGRWLLARAGTGDSIWVVDLPPKTFTGSVASAWGDDLPLVALDGTLLVRQGADVAAYRPDSVREEGRIPGGAADLWLATGWIPSGSSRSAALADAPGPAAAAGDTTAGALYVQVSISQNKEWSEGMAQQLTRAGLTAKVLPPTSGDDGYRVVLGPFATREQAEDTGRKLGRPYWIYQPSQ